MFRNVVHLQKMLLELNLQCLLPVHLLKEVNEQEEDCFLKGKL